MDSNQNFTRRADAVIGGYTKLNLKSGLPSKWQCPLCNCLMKEAIQTFRGEMACETCFLEGKGGGDICPIDKEHIEDGQFFKDKHTRRQIEQLATYCINRSGGCNWEGVVLHVEEHVGGCTFERISCERCLETFLRKEFVNHQLRICRFRTIKCRYCSTTLEALSLEEHEVGCHMKPMKCPYGCGEDLALNGLYQHVEKCVKVTSGNVCPYQLVGCTYKPDRAVGLDHHLHTDMSVHAALAVATVKYLTEYNSKLKDQLAVEKTARLQLESNIEQQAREKNTMGEQISEMKKQIESIKAESGEMEQKFDNNVKQVEQNLREIQQSTQAATLQEMDAKLTEISNQYQYMDVTSRGGAASDGASSTSSTEVQRGIEQMDQLESSSAVLSANLSDLQLKLQLLENTCYDGRQIWKVDNVSHRASQAVTGKVTALHSAPCFQKKGGYKFCARLYLNGDGMGRGSHVSLFFVVMKGEYDALLQWPFTERVSFRLINPYNPEESVRESFVPDRNSSSFKRPTNEMNIAARCPMFMRKEQLKGFIVDDTLFIEITITPP